MNAENMKLWLQRMLTALVGEGHLSHVEANGLAANIREEIDNGINEIARLGIELATANDNELKADKGWRESSTRIIALEAQLNQRRELYRKLQEELAAKSAEGAKEAVDSSRLAYKAQAEENARQLHAAISRAEFAERECQRNLVNWHESQHQLRSKLDQEAVLEQQVDDLRHALHASRVLCESLNEPGPTPPCVGGYKANALAEGGVE